jgi:hypothetical protein
MLRQSLVRSALRTGRQSCNASRTFATSSKRQAEVQLTVGKAHRVRSCEDREVANLGFRWQASLNRRYVWTIGQA